MRILKFALPLFITSMSFGQDLAKLAETEKRDVRGADQAWFFRTNEIRQAALGEFWTKPWNEVSANQADPTAAILEFHEALGAKGVEL
ncbi:MAG: hypothetical protein AAF226_15800, partial [Verrucomicrobiota bacterium]